MLNIDDLTIGEMKQIQSLLNNTNIDSNQPYSIGKNMLIRTVTMILVGRVVEVGPQEIVIEDASWVADTGRFHEALEKGVVEELEPYPDGKVIVGRGSVIDACIWNHDLMRETK